MNMTLAETIYQKSLSLPPEKAREVIDFIDFIKDRPKGGHDRSDDQASASASLLEVFEQAGLVGCVETDEQWSTNYKAQLDFSGKHGGAS